MFWGCRITPKNGYEFNNTGNRVIHITHACLSNSTTDSKVYVKLQVGKTTYNLCALQKDKWESSKLDNFLLLTGDNTQTYKLLVEESEGAKSAGLEVHITGCMETEDEENDEDFDDLEAQHNTEVTAETSRQSKGSKQIDDNLEEANEELDDDDFADNDLLEGDDDDVEIEQLLKKHPRENSAQGKPTKLQKLDDGKKASSAQENKGNKQIANKTNQFNKQGKQQNHQQQKSFKKNPKVGQAK